MILVARDENLSGLLSLFRTSGGSWPIGLGVLEDYESRMSE